MKNPKFHKKYFNFYYYFGRLSDIRFVAQAFFVLVVLLISWSGVKSIQTNYDLQKQISAIRQQNEVQSLLNKNQALQNQYYYSNQYLDLSARQNFGLASQGETELIVPRSVALKYTVNVTNLSSNGQSGSHKPGYQTNIQSWIDFFLHKSQN